MNILLTGGAGYIGSHTSLLLIDKGHEVTIVDNLISGNSKLVPKKANFINSDISDEKKIRDLLKKEKFDLIMHFAGLVKVEESLLHPERYKLNNVDKAKTFIKACMECGLNKIIFSSSAGVYGNTPSMEKLNESSELMPTNPYSKTKHEFEKYLLNLSKEKKIKCIILRYFNVAGADEKKRSGLVAKKSNNLIKSICEVATNKRSNIVINGDDYDTQDGTPVRDFIHVTDLAEMHTIAAENLDKKNSEIYNCGYGEGYSVKQVVLEMEKILNRSLNKKIGRRREGDIPYSVADTTKFKKEFDWNPKYNSLNYILKTALEWEKIFE
tara:strand:- start:453 stop:1427 length:975 start_codon:yes stop_codon:yes gene_type:complete